MSVVDRGRLYRLMRTVHLWAALTMATGVAIYAVTGFFVIHSDLLPDGDHDTSERVTLPALSGAAAPAEPDDGAALAAAAIIARDLDVRGRLEEIRREQDGWIFIFLRPGTTEAVVWTPAGTVVDLYVQRDGLQAAFDRLHHLHGYRGGLRFWLWAAFLDLVSLSMFLFAGTGVYLWYRTKADRRLGWVLLGGSTLFVSGAVAHLLLSR